MTSSDPIWTAAQVQEAALRQAIADLLEQCTQEQQARLHEILLSAPYKTLDACPAQNLGAIYGLIQRTVEKNRREANDKA